MEKNSIFILANPEPDQDDTLGIEEGSLCLALITLEQTTCPQCETNESINHNRKEDK